MPSLSACWIFLTAAWTRCSARAPATQNTPSTRCVCVRAANCTCPPLTAPPPARPPTVCVYGAESGDWGLRPTPERPSFSSSFPLFLLFVSIVTYSTPPLRGVVISSHPMWRIRCNFHGLCVLIFYYSSFNFISTHFLYTSFYPLHIFYSPLFLTTPPSLLPSFPLSGIQE